MNFLELAARITSALEAGENLHWRVGDLLVQELPDTRGAAKGLASELGRSAAWVSDHLRTARAFSEDERAADMTFSLHSLCARTSEPIAWLQTAVELQLSTRELRDLMVQKGDIRARADSTSAITCPNCSALREWAEAEMRCRPDDITEFNARYGSAEVVLEILNQGAA